jgi:AcrR family transcriptional regulator
LVKASVGSAAIINAARIALKSTPPGELTFNQIAGLAGVDQRLIRYYFGSLPDLLRATAVEITKEIRSKIVAANTQKRSVRETVAARVSVFLDTFGSNPHYHRLVVDYLYNARGPERDEALKGLQLSIEELAGLLGKVGPATLADARLMHATMAALCEFFHSSRQVFVALFGEEAKTEAFREKYSEFVTDLLSAAADRDLAGPR